MNGPSNNLQVRIDAMARGLSYQQAELWIAANPNATGKELLVHLGELANEVREQAIEVEMASCKLDRLEAAMLVDRYMNYSSVLEDGPNS